MRLARNRPAALSTFRCSLTVGWLTPSFSAMSTPQTPSFTRSPSLCGGKWRLGCFSHSRIWKRRSLPSALKVRAIDILPISHRPNYCQENGKQEQAVSDAAVSTTERVNQAAIAALYPVLAPHIRRTPVIELD